MNYAPLPPPSDEIFILITAAMFGAAVLGLLYATGVM